MHTTHNYFYTYISSITLTPIHRSNLTDPPKMPKVSSIALAAALVRSAAAAGCYPAYVSSGSYGAGAQVSAPTPVETSAQEPCVSGTSGCSTTCTTPGTNGCPETGTKTVTTTNPVTHNYVCVSNANSAFCGQSSYTPGSYYSDQAWTKESTACTVS